MFGRASLYKRREENQLDATEWFIAQSGAGKQALHLTADHQQPRHCTPYVMIGKYSLELLMMGI